MVSDTIWGVEDGSKWLTSDDDYEKVKYDYDIVNVEENKGKISKPK